MRKALYSVLVDRSHALRFPVKRDMEGVMTTSGHEYECEASLCSFGCIASARALGDFRNWDFGSQVMSGGWGMR